jgi:hypothetical protein
VEAARYKRTCGRHDFNRIEKDSTEHYCAPRVKPSSASTACAAIVARAGL